MRFLIGLLAGGLMTITVVSATDASPDAIVTDLRGAWTHLMESAKNTAVTEELLIDVPSSTHTTTHTTPHTTTDTAIHAELDPVEPVFAAEPPVPTDLVTTPDIDQWTSSPVATPPASRASGAVSQPPTPSFEADDAGTATIWDPFHSEVSATGFAKRLSLQLGYPFAVTKQGPARYLVIFDYASEAERDLLEQQIAAVTGYRRP